jgi:hypothetical protein
MNVGKSFIGIEVDTTQVDAAIRDIIRSQSAAVRRSAFEQGAAAARDVIQAYYQDGGSALWSNPSLPTHGPGRTKTQWWRSVAESWFVGKVTGSGAQISSGALGLAHKVTGGTIKAKRKKFLTIPIVPEAHGRRAKEYARAYKPLFAAKGFLMEATDDPEKPRAVYALKKSVTQKPWPNALPPESTYINAFIGDAVEHILQTMEGKV